MVHIAICDDNDSDRSKASELCQSYFDEKLQRPVELTTFENPVDLLAQIDKGMVFDLLLIDIYMPGLLGTEAVRELRDNANDTPVIFLTTSLDHAYEAFGLRADGYLHKPFSVEQFESVIGPVVEKIDARRKAALVIKTREGVRRLNFDDFLYAETLDKIQLVHMRTEENAEVRASSKALFEMLSHDTRFFKAGSSYILNLDNVRAINGIDVTLVNGEQVSVPTRYEKPLEDAFFDRAFE